MHPEHPESNLNPTPNSPVVVPTPSVSTTYQRRMVPRWTAITTGVAGLALGATLLGGAAFAQTPSADDSTLGTVQLQVQVQGNRQLRSLPWVATSEDGATREMRPMVRGLMHVMKLDTIAEVLGLTPAELNTQLEAGTALTDIITAQGSTVDVVVDALVSEAQEMLDLAVSEGRLTADEVTERIAALPAELTERIESGTFMHRAGPGGRDGADCAPGMVPAEPGAGGENATPEVATPDTGSDEDATPTTS